MLYVSKKFIDTFKFFNVFFNKKNQAGFIKFIAAV